jgi:hypothetical protein
MVQMKLTASVLLAAAAIVPVLANGLEAETSLLTREDNELESSFARDLDLDFEEREFEDDLFEREPGRGKFLKKAFKFGVKGAKAGSSLPSVTPPETPSETREFNDDVFEREFDEELYERARIGRGGKGLLMKAAGGRKGMKSGGGKKGRMMKAGGGKGRKMKSGRGKGAMKALKKGNKALGKVSQSIPSAPAESQPPPQAEPEAREFNDDILEREFDEELSEREFDEELSEREFDEELMEREIDDDELFSRDVDFELFEREPEPFFDRIKKWWKNLTKGKKKNAPAAADDAAETRSVDEMEVLEREYYDELD